jgi:hypothetical protein
MSSSSYSPSQISAVEELIATISSNIANRVHARKIKKLCFYLACGNFSRGSLYFNNRLVEYRSTSRSIIKRTAKTDSTAVRLHAQTSGKNDPREKLP